MRRFNPEKELRKLQNGNRNRIIFSILFGIILLTIGYSFALYQVRYTKRIIYTKVAPFNNKDINLAVMVDGLPSSTNDFPTKNSGKSYEKTVCDDNEDKHVKAYWDDDKWALVVETTKKAKCTVYFKTGTVTSTPNPPELYQGLIPVTFSDNGEVIIADPDSSDWYNYDKQKWANAVLVTTSKYNEITQDGELRKEAIGTKLNLTTDNNSEILQMYVWIPRYKYKLFNVYNVGVPEQEIQIKFEAGTETTGNVSCIIDEKGKEICNNPANGDWFTHPAFKFGNTDLTGIWVGKFETSGNAAALTIKPNITSWRQINIKTMFNATRAIKETYATNFNLNKEEIDTHMMKNMDWGAMAYLTHSKYGRCTDSGCTEVAMNTNNNYITGYNGTAYTWDTEEGQKASTTGNMYGIYDTNGGAWEYMMSVAMIDAAGSGIYYSSSGFSAADLQNKEKYYDLYEYDTVETSHRRGHLGDATRETLKTFGNNIGGWYDDYANFSSNGWPWFNHGGDYGDGTHAGTFAFSRYTGEAFINESFRVVLTAEDKAS